MGKTSIEWTDHSVNPFRATLGNGRGHYCEKVSPGCKNCYSSALQPRFRMPQFQEQRRANVEHFLDVSKLEDVLRRRKPTTYFWCDMTDMFGDWVPNEWIAACFGVMAATPWHTHQVLTKRSKRMREWFRWEGSRHERKRACVITARSALEAARPGFIAQKESLRFVDAEYGRWPLPNVVLMVSAEDQQRADERIPDLLATPAAVRGVSAEPLLGDLDLSVYLRPHSCDEWPREQAGGPNGCAGHPMPALDWLIVGGESGRNARPCDVAWIRSIVDQCKAAGVACFVKQLGPRPYESVSEQTRGMGGVGLSIKHRKGGDPSEWPEELRVRRLPAVPMKREWTA